MRTRFMIFLKTALAFLFFFPAIMAKATQPIQFRHINTKGYQVNTICRDTNGLLWFGTSTGLVSLPQLESRSPQNYNRQHPEMNTRIKQITCDEQGRLCISTQNNDVMLYTPATDFFEADAAAMLAREWNIEVWKQFALVTEENGQGWAWKDGMLYMHHHPGGKTETISLDLDDIINLGHNERTLVMLTSNRTLCFFSSNGKKIIRRVALPDEMGYAFTMLIDQKDCVWMMQRNVLWHYDYAADQWNKAIELKADVTAIALDGEGRIWVGTSGQGIFICDGNGTLVQHLVHSPYDRNSLQNDRIGHLYYDEKNNAMWVAYFKNGLSVYNEKQSWMMVNGSRQGTGLPPVTDVLKIAQTTVGTWLGLESGGLYLRQADANEWKMHSETDGNAAVTALMTDSNNTLWAGLYQQGLIHIGSNGTVTRHFEGQSPFAIAEDAKGNIYVALLGKGVWRLDPVSGLADDLKLEAGYVFDLKYHKDQLHAATTNGYYVLNDSGQWKKRGKGRFRSICIDGEGYVFLLGDYSGHEGLTVLTSEGTPMEIPTALRNMPLKNISVDSEGILWLTTDDELLMLRHTVDNIEYNTFSIIPKDEGFFYNPNAIYIDKNRTLWLGTTAGYQCMDTRLLVGRPNDKSSQQTLVIAAISINDEVLAPGRPFNGRLLLSSDVAFANTLHLEAEENNLVIECVSRDGTNVMNDTYYYQVRGLDKTWRPLRDHTVVLSNLPAGHYRLLTKTKTSEESQLLDIIIAPPLWNTWWAWLIYLLLALAIGTTVVHYFRNRRKYQTKLRQLEQEQEQQAKINEMKLHFFTNISHDMRTPLSLIIGPVEEIQRKTTDIGMQSTLQMIHRNANQLLQLVNQILDFRRLELGQEKLVLSFGDIVTLMRDICEAFRLKATKDGINFTFTSKVEHIETLFDTDKTNKMMMNLLSNAFKFTPRGGSITVTLDIVDHQAVVLVADTGIGIPDADKPHIFNRFFQSANGNMQSQGSGIGLHIVKEYARLQGGNITVRDNDNGQGTVFTFTLPIRMKNEEFDTAQYGSNNNTEENSSNLNSQTSSLKTVLIVDDNHDLLSYISQSLAAEYNILTATNGQEALNLLSNYDIDIIVSDVMMDQMDGLQLCRTVKTDITTSHIPVVLLTAKTLIDNELEGLEAGADDYVTKPFSMNVLQQRIRNILERSRRQHERFACETDISPSEITVTSLDEKFITRAIAIVEEHISEEDFGVEQLSSELCMHRSQLYRKLQHLTGKTPILFIRLIRLKRGKQLLEQSGMFISEVAYRVGFNSPKIFSRYFKEEFGSTPKEYLEQNKQNDETHSNKDNGANPHGEHGTSNYRR